MRKVSKLNCSTLRLFELTQIFSNCPRTGGNWKYNGMYVADGRTCYVCELGEYGPSCILLTYTEQIITVAPSEKFSFGLATHVVNIRSYV
jgi:hypothetical protein